MNRSAYLAWGLGAILALSAAPSVAAEGDAAGSEPFNISPHGFAGLQSFRVAAYKNRAVDFPSQIFNNSVLNFTFDLNSGDKLAIRAGMEGYVTFSTVPYDRLGAVGKEAEAVPLWSWYMAQAEIAYTLGEKDDFFHGDVGVGLFPFKYNEEARNLGEYLFRSGTYPGWLLNTFDWTATRLTGVRMSGDLWGAWHNDVMLTTEMEWFPFYDLSLSWVSRLPVGKFLELGGGAQFSRFLPANDSLTTPRITQAGNKQVTNFYNPNGPDTAIGYDTAFYTFSGIKVMGRATLDPKGFFDFEPSNRPLSLGKHDGKLFFEVAVLGVKNQGKFYNDIKRRMPVMFGFNVPVFNLLDVLTLQMEYYAMPYPNDFGWQTKFAGYGVPQPTNGFAYGDPEKKYSVANPLTGQSNFYTKDNWKWSVYARRWLGNHLAIVGQVGRDHWRASTPFAQFRDTEEALSTSDHWYGALKIVSVW